jgi:hypothetical protein
MQTYNWFFGTRSKTANVPEFQGHSGNDVIIVAISFAEPRRNDSLSKQVRNEDRGAHPCS